MPPPKPVAAKAPAKPAAKAPAKTTAKAPAKAKPAGGAAKPAAAKTPAPKKDPEPPKPEPVVIHDVMFKEVDAKVVYDREGTVKASGKWALIMDENSLIGRFLRHRDVNMLSTPDNNEMQPETIRKALLGSIKFGKPFVIDMMESEMYEFVKERFDEILPGLLHMVIDKSIIKDENYMQIVKESDGDQFQNRYDFNIEGFSFIIITSCMAPNENLLRNMYPVKVIN